MGSKQDQVGSILGAAIGAVGGISTYIGALALAGWAGIPAAPLVGGIFGALGVYVFYSRRAARQTPGSEPWTNQQQIDALNAHTLVVLTDAKGSIVDVNQSFLDNTGWSREELIGCPESRLLANSDLRLYADIRHALSSGQSWSGPSRIRSKAGEEIVTETTILPRTDRFGVINGTMSVRTIIRESEIPESERNLLSTFKLLKDEVYVFSAETLRFSYLNDAALKTTGWSADTITGKSLNELTPEFNEERFLLLAKPLMNGEVIQLRRTLMFDGRPYDASLQLIRMTNFGDQFVCVMRDATDRLESERINSEFVSTVSHELRSPMTSIKGAMGLLLSGAAGDFSAKARNLLEISHRNADRLILILNDILDLEKLHAEGMAFDNQDEDMATLVKEAVEAIKPFSDRFDVRIETSGLDTALMACFDQTRMMQVMTNLLSNAVKFSPAGGTVQVELRLVENQLRVEVRDEGKGIPADKQSQIFERFSHISSEEGSGMRSTGLGLSIVKSIVEKQNGTVGFDSREGKGSTFYFQLPLCQDNSSEGALVATG